MNAPVLSPLRFAALLLLAFCGWLTSVASSKPPVFPDRGRAGVVDAAHVLPEATCEALDRRVVAWDRASGHQLVVATVPDLQGLDVKTYGYRLGRAWGLGDKARNDGVILLLAMAERKVRIEVGPGLEGELTDALTAAILRDRVVPRLKAGDVPGALDAGADAIMATAGASAVVRHEPAGSPLWAVVAGWLAVIVVVGGAGWGWWRWMILEPRRERKRNEQRVVDLIHMQSMGRNPVVTPVIAPDPAPSASPRSGSGWSWGSSSGSSSSSPDSGSSSSSSGSGGFDSGGGSFSGGGSDSSW